MIRHMTFLAAMLTLITMSGISPGIARAAGSVAISAWTCPDDVDTSSEDPVYFASECETEAVDLTFALTTGELTRRRITAPGTPASWPSVDGTLIATLEDPAGEAAVVFCGADGEAPERFEAPEATFEFALPSDTAWLCSWYRVAPSAFASPIASPARSDTATASATATLVPTLVFSPTATSTSSPTPEPTATPSPTSTSTPTLTVLPSSTASPEPTETPTATHTETAAPTSTPSPTPTQTASPTPSQTATSTPTLVPTIAPSPTPTFTSTATSTPEPTVTPLPTSTPVPTATQVPTTPPEPTSTKEPGPRALSTAIARDIEDADPDFHLDLHQMTYELEGDLLVYPDPEGPDSGQFLARDFVIDVTFINPPRDDDGVWDYGVLFGPTLDGGFYRIAIQSTGFWTLSLDGETIDEGELDGVQSELRARNQLRLIVSGDRGILFVNGEISTSFRFDEREETGQMWLVTTNQDSSDIAFLDLDVWKLP